MSSAGNGFNPRTPCGVRLGIFWHCKCSMWFQSTHSLRSATSTSKPCMIMQRFQSTHSLRSATVLIVRVVPWWMFQSTHSLRSATGQPLRNNRNNRFQSTHSLRSATFPGIHDSPFFRFQSTHSLRSATGELGTDDPNPTVSIHALLAECDVLHPPLLSDARSFNPRTPCGVRPAQLSTPPESTLFQSTHSLRSATGDNPLETIETLVSIHALLAECDRN